MSVKKKQTYSDLINKCYSSNIRYLSVDEERLFTKNAIRIVIETKQKRKQMYAKKEDDTNPGLQTTTSNRGIQINNSLARDPIEPAKMGLMSDNSTRIVENSAIDQSTLVNSSVRTSIKGNKYAITSNKRVNSRIQSSTKKPFLTDIADSRSNASGFVKNQSSVNLRSYAGSDFISSANVDNKNEIINSILKKSEFWEDRLTAVGYKSEVKSILIENKGKDDVSMNKLKSAFGDFTNKEIMLLERKNTEMIREYNFLIDEAKKKRKILEGLCMAEFGLVGPDPNIEINMKQDILALMDKLQEIENQKNKSQEKRRRMERIIDICELNSIQNEQWIRG